jgi:hypothetical protein
MKAHHAKQKRRGGQFPSRPTGLVPAASLCLHTRNRLLDGFVYTQIRRI